MGTLRTLLAISVAITHSYGYFFVGGQNAVQLFYIISGFLISYVLTQQKAYSSYSRFYISRILRLYPIYLVVATLTLVAYYFSALYVKKPEFFSVWSNIPMDAGILLIISNLFLFAQDWIMFLGIQDNQLVFLTDFLKSDILLFRGLLVPQAWTLGVELTFYLIAPFVLHHRWRIYCLLVCSLGIRGGLIYLGIGWDDPWTYRFFPAELALFLIGALAHQILLPMYNRLPERQLKLYAQYATIVLVFIVVIFFKIPIPELYRTLVLFVMFVIALPLLFIFSNYYDLDRAIGDLSYPVYICHILVLMVVMAGSNHFAWLTKGYIAICCVIFSLVFAYILNHFVGGVCERYRSRFKNNIVT